MATVRGLLHFAAVTIPIAVGPLITGRPLDESYFSSYLLLMVPGLFFVYGFIYMVQRKPRHDRADSRGARG